MKEIPFAFSENFKCDLCHFFQRWNDYAILCTHPLGAALKRYPDKEAGFSIGIICKNWQEDRAIKIPASLRKSISSRN